jgi:hypothetical protein
MRPYFKFPSSSIICLLLFFCNCHCNDGGDAPDVKTDTVIVHQGYQDTIPLALLKPNEIDSSTLAKYFGVKIANDSIKRNITVEENADIFINGSEEAFINLHMKKNSRIVVNNKLTYCHITFTGAEFDENVKIIADADAGTNGANGIAYDAVASSGKSGDKGFAGDNGTNGGKGVNLNIQLGLRAIKGKLMISSTGGRGGNGGNGGNGQKGAPARCTDNAGNGGIGGAGGAGGNGGQNGNIYCYFYLEPGGPDPAQIELVETIASPGAGGLGGPGGANGNSIRCGFYTNGGGNVGPVGPGGSAGTPGIKGSNKLEQPHNIVNAKDLFVAQ